jgi:ABC-type transporter Mla MlaB component
MLRTMIADTPFEQKWVLQGRLCGQWAEDLKEKWESTKSAREGRKCEIDLEDVTFVDTKGEGVLLEIAAQGAMLLASRAYMKHVLESLTERHNSSDRGKYAG